MSTADPGTGVPVTGEAVALDLRVARLPSRTLALVIDLCVQLPLLFLLLVLAAWAASSSDPAMVGALVLVASVAVIVGYPALCETFSHGRTLGKLALGLRVVRGDGGPVRFRHSLVRALFLVLELWITSGVVGLVACLLSAQGKRLGDHFAGTIVVIERVARAAAVPPPLQVPAGLEGWAASLDLTTLPDAAAAQARQLLARWPALTPDVRERLAAALAGEIAARVAPPPPAGCPAPTYLAAVLGEHSPALLRRLGGCAPACGSPPAAPAAGPAPDAVVPATAPAGSRGPRAVPPPHLSRHVRPRAHRRLHDDTPGGRPENACRRR